MSGAVRIPPPVNEPILSYAPGTPERAALKGMGLTFKHLVNPKKVTLQYPEEQPDLSPRWRGTHRMDAEDTRSQHQRRYAGTHRAVNPGRRLRDAGVRGVCGQSAHRRRDPR